MIKRSPILAVAVMTIVAMGCDNHLLVGQNADAAGGAGTMGSPGIAGAAGTMSSSGAAGGAGTMVAGMGTGGTGAADAGTTTRVVTPLPISADEALTRIAAVLWNAPPDADLLSQAALGHITTVEDLYGVIRQMLVDQRAATGVGAFYRWWLNLPALATLSKDTAVFPAYTSALQADMASETETYGVNVTLAMNGSYQTLLTGNFSFLDARLADIYGVSGVAGDSLQLVMLPPGQRAGLLTQPALQALGSLATRNSPARRGAYVEGRFLCFPPPPPPVSPTAGPPDTSTPGVTLRQAMETEEEQAMVCTACHQTFDPSGFAFEGFDAIGRVRTTDNGAPVDVSNLSIYVPMAGSPVVNGPIELANMLASNPVAEDCMTRKWLSFALGRDLQSSDDAWVTRIDQTFASADYNLKELIAAVLMSGPFLAP